MEGIIEDWLLGAAVFDRDSEGIDEGQSVTEGAPLGIELGSVDGCDEGSEDGWLDG